MFKKYRIRTFLFNIAAVTLSTAMIGSLIFYFASQALVKNVEESLQEIAIQGAKIVDKEIEGHLHAIEAVARVDIIKNEDVPWEEKQKLLQSEAEINGFRRMSIADVNGNSRTNEGSRLDIRDRLYFKKAMEGKSNVSEPIVSRVDGFLSTTFAVPIYNKGIISGVLYATHNAEDLSKITDQIRLGTDGSSFITNSEGMLIAYKDRAVLYDALMNPEKVKNNPELNSIFSLQERIVNMKNGVEEYDYQGVKNIAAFAPIGETGWYLTVSAPGSQVLKSVNEIRIFILLTLALMLIVFGVMWFQLKFLRKNLSREQIKTSTAINTGNLLVIEMESGGKLLNLNNYAELKLGKGDSEKPVNTIYDIVPEENRELLVALLNKVNADIQLSNIQIPVMGKNSSIVHVLWNISIIKDKFKKTSIIEFIGIDVTERVEYEKKLLENHQELTSLYEEISASEEELKQQFDELAYNQEQLRKSEERYSFVIEASGMGIWDYDMGTGHMFHSSRWHQIFGLLPGEQEINPGTLSALIHPEDVPNIEKSINEHLINKTDSYECEYRVILKDGSIKWIKENGKVLWDSFENPVRMAGSHTDITDKKEYENRIQKLAYFDVLTGLPNRINFEENVTRIFENNTCKNALIFLDIDNFKYVNDSFGHSVGDRLIVEVSERIANITKEGDIVSRLGGDEFTILMINIEDAAEAVAYAENLLKILDGSFYTKNITLKITASIGIAIFPENGDTFEEVLKNADTAMYHVKNSGKRSFSLFHPSMNATVYDRMVMESNLRSAIDNCEFVLNYQPQFDLRSGRLCGFESLIRWQHPQNGLLFPNKFIPVAEETELIISIGKWVIRTACTFIKELYNLGVEDIHIAVNVSIVQLMQNDFVETVMGILNEMEINAGSLELEITETILMESINSNLEKIQKLQAHGVKVALDDFGTGYSSLTYLRQLPISTLKIDKAFIDNISKQKEDLDITGSIITLAHTLGHRVVAEGVETKEQMQCLEQQGCDLIQGYLLGKPMKEQEAIRIVQSQNSIKDFLNI